MTTTDRPVLLEALTRSVVGAAAGRDDATTYNGLCTMASIERLTGRAYAWWRPMTDPCEDGTPGCSIRHTADAGGCEPW